MDKVENNLHIVSYIWFTFHFIYTPNQLFIMVQIERKK